jgi:hypothetical protein
MTPTSRPPSPPSSRPPAGLPDSGNAKYAIAAVVLVGAAAGLFAWRSCSSRTEAVAPAPPLPSASASAAPSANAKLEDIPPPPPPEEKASATGPRIVYVQANGGCDGKCTGTSPPELGPALQVHARQARRCYEQALSQDSSLKGRVSINVKIGPAGNVCSATVASNDMASPSVANCAANVFRSSSGYPSPRGGCIEATVPLNFQPQGQ